MTRVTEIIWGNLPPHQHLIHRCLSLENLIIDVNSRIWPGLWSPDRLKSSSFRPAFSFRAFSENADQFHSSADCWLAGQRGSLHIKSVCVLLWLSSGVMMHCKVAMRRSTALENYEGGGKIACWEETRAKCFSASEQSRAILSQDISGVWCSC